MKRKVISACTFKVTVGEISRDIIHAISDDGFIFAFIEVKGEHLPGEWIQMPPLPDREKRPDEKSIAELGPGGASGW